MTQPLISVITPVYNNMNYVVDCIKSVQAQTYLYWEMLIINDGSTDDTAKVINDYINQSGDERVKLFNREHAGMLKFAETYNFALHQSKGEYIGLLDSDDLWEPTKLERQVEIMQKQPQTILSWGQAYLINPDLTIYMSAPVENLAHEKYYNNTPTGNILNLLCFENPVIALTILIRKSSLLEIGGFKQGYGLTIVDLPTLMALCLKGNFYYDKFPYGRWRYSPDNATKKNVVEITEGRFNMSLDYLKKANEENFTCVTVTENEIRNYFNRKILAAYSRAGRYKLTKKDFKGARKDYLNAIFYKGLTEPMWRLRSLTGYIFSLLHLDVEWLAKLLGKKTYKS